MFNKFRYIFVFLVSLTFLARPAGAENVDINDTKRVEQIIRNYLLENPEVIAEAIVILQERAQTEARDASIAALSKNRDLLENDPLSIVTGNPKGDVTLVEFYDYRCPYCRESHADIMRLLEEDKNLKVVFKQFPVKDRPGEIPVSLISARIAMAAEEQGLFLPFHHAMLSSPPPLTERKIYEIAEQVGIDVEKAREDMKKSTVTQHLRETLILANEIGATGTPTFVIGDYLIPGMVNFDILKQVIDITREAKMTAKIEDAGD